MNASFGFSGKQLRPVFVHTKFTKRMMRDKIKINNFVSFVVVIGNRSI